MGGRGYVADRPFKGGMNMKFQKAGLSAVMIAMMLLAGGCAGGTQDAGARVQAEEAGAGAEEAGTRAQATGTEAQEEEAGAQAAGTGAQAAGTRPDTAKAISGNPDREAKKRTPIYADQIKDGVYPIKVDSSSSMFQITACRLTVKDGAMSAVMTMGGTGYLKLYMGTGEAALKASEADYIPYVETAGGAHTFKVPVKALDMEIDCSAFSKKKEKWYDRVLVFCSDSIPPDCLSEENVTTAGSLNLENGMYTAKVVLTGGSGRASVESPASLRVEDGNVFATIIWGSANYDYMKVDGEKFDLISTEGNSAFEIPVAVFDRNMPVIADTVAMSEPHEIEYGLIFDSATIVKVQ